MRIHTRHLGPLNALRRSAVLTLLLAAACGPLRTGRDRNEATIIFQNESTEQAAVYAVVLGSQAMRLGTVLSLRTDTLRVPASVTSRAAGVSIVARLLAQSRTPSTGPITIAPGDVLHVRLDSGLSQLFVSPAVSSP